MEHPLQSLHPFEGLPLEEMRSQAGAGALGCALLRLRRVAAPKRLLQVTKLGCRKAKAPSLLCWGLGRETAGSRGWICRVAFPVVLSVSLLWSPVTQTEVGLRML